MRQNAFSAGGSAPDPAAGAYSAPPDPLAGFGEGNSAGGMKRARDGKGTEGEGKEWREKGEGRGGMEIRVRGILRHGFKGIDAPAKMATENTVVALLGLLCGPCMVNPVQYSRCDAVDI